MHSTDTSRLRGSCCPHPCLAMAIPQPAHGGSVSWQGGQCPHWLQCQPAAVTSPSNSPTYSPHLHRQFPPLKSHWTNEHPGDLVRELSSVLHLVLGVGGSCCGATRPWAWCAGGAPAQGDTATCLGCICFTSCLHEAVRICSVPSWQSISPLKALQHPVDLGTQIPVSLPLAGGITES